MSSNWRSCFIGSPTKILCSDPLMFGQVVQPVSH